MRVSRSPALAGARSVRAVGAGSGSRPAAPYPCPAAVRQARGALDVGLAPTGGSEIRSRPAPVGRIAAGSRSSAPPRRPDRPGSVLGPGFDPPEPPCTRLRRRDRPSNRPRHGLGRRHQGLAWPSAARSAVLSAPHAHHQPASWGDRTPPAAAQRSAWVAHGRISARRPAHSSPGRPRRWVDDAVCRRFANAQGPPDPPPPPPLSSRRTPRGGKGL